MDLIFEKGDSLNPKGHALVYFRSNVDNKTVAATYIVVLPISVEISKYVPPFLMSQVGNMDEQNLSAFAFPPIPEEMENEAEITCLADLRKDDLLFGGEINLTNPTECMEKINDLVGQYTSLYNTTVIDTNKDQSESDSGIPINDVLYQLMSPNDKLTELGRLVGKLRFGIEGQDEQAIKDSETELTILSNYLPPNHNIEKLIFAIKSADKKSEELADLYVKRCYSLVNEQYDQLSELESKIDTLNSTTLQ
ncbi:MAG: hypothetical protein FI718_05005 [SAR202 cluster bacterium]|nr:hypothetical protein [SAR202 cluster bacterium]